LHSARDVSTDVETVAWLNSFQVTPNPTNGTIYIEIGAPENLDAQISIHNLTGQSVYRQQLAINKGLQTLSLDLSNLTSGVYFISVQSEHAVVTKKLIKH